MILHLVHQSMLLSELPKVLSKCCKAIGLTIDCPIGWAGEATSIVDSLFAGNWCFPWEHSSCRECLSCKWTLLGHDLSNCHCKGWRVTLLSRSSHSHPMVYEVQQKEGCWWGQVHQLASDEMSASFEHRSQDLEKFIPQWQAATWEHEAFQSLSISVLSFSRKGHCWRRSFPSHQCSFAMGRQSEVHGHDHE